MPDRQKTLRSSPGRGERDRTEAEVLGDRRRARSGRPHPRPAGTKRVGQPGDGCSAVLLQQGQEVRVWNQVAEDEVSPGRDGSLTSLRRQGHHWTTAWGPIPSRNSSPALGFASNQRRPGASRGRGLLGRGRGCLCAALRAMPTLALGSAHNVRSSKVGEPSESSAGGGLELHRQTKAGLSVYNCSSSNFDMH